MPRKSKSAPRKDTPGQFALTIILQLLGTGFQVTGPKAIDEALLVIGFGWLWLLFLPMLGEKYELTRSHPRVALISGLIAVIIFAGMHGWGITYSENQKDIPPPNVTINNYFNIPNPSPDVLIESGDQSMLTRESLGDTNPRSKLTLPPPTTETAFTSLRMGKPSRGLISSLIHQTCTPRNALNRGKGMRALVSETSLVLSSSLFLRPSLLTQKTLSVSEAESNEVRFH